MPVPELDSTIIYEMHSDAKIALEPAPAPVELPTSAPDDVIEPVVPQMAATREDEELTRLRREQDVVGERLGRLREMEQLEHEHKRLEREISDRLGKM